MINYRNKVQLIGEVSAIQVFETPKGILYCNFQITTNETITNLDGEIIPKEIHHQCIAYKKHAAFLRDLITNGNVVALEGRLIHIENVRAFPNKTKTVVEVNEIIKLH
jgi:single-stranded DNA-binding protein